MAGEIESIGDIVTGAAAAHAVSRSAGARHDAAADIEHGMCLNCGTTLAGDYCHGCGQSAHIHRSLGAFFHDLVHGVLHFEGRSWRTLPLLAWRPGELTRRYVHGERARFVSPMALFLFAVFLLFAIASFTTGEGDLANVRLPVEQNIVAEVQSLNDRIATLEAGIAGTDADADKREENRADLTALEQKRSAMMVAYRGISGKQDITPETLGQREDRLDEVIRDINDELGGKQRVKTSVDGVPIEDLSSEDMDGFSKNWFTRRVIEGVEKARANPALVIYKIKTNAYKFGWALIPLSVPFVWLVMVGRRMRERHLYDHVVFTTYSIAFMMMLLVALVVAGLVGVSAVIVAPIAIVYPPFHMYRQLKGAYRLSRPVALLRTALLLVFSIVALLLFVSLLVTVGLVG